MSTPLTLTPHRRSDGTALLTVVGEIDMSNSEAFAEAIEAVQGPLVIDLTGVEYLDSAALTVLFTHADRVELIAPVLLVSVLTISGLGDLTTIHTPETDTPHSAGH